MPASVPVITLTPNPSLDETWLLESFHEDGINACGRVRLDPGGKGINVSRLLRALGIDALRRVLQAGRRASAPEPAGGRRCFRRHDRNRRGDAPQPDVADRADRTNHKNQSSGPADSPCGIPQDGHRLGNARSRVVSGGVRGRFRPEWISVETACFPVFCRRVRICTDCEIAGSGKLTRSARSGQMESTLNWMRFSGRPFALPSTDCAYAAASMLARRTGAIAVVTRGEEERSRPPRRESK